MWNHKLIAAIVKFPCEKCKYEAPDRGSLLKHLKSKHESDGFMGGDSDQGDVRGAGRKISSNI